MAITETDLNLFHVNARLELYDDFQALLLDHLLDHLQLLSYVACFGDVTDGHTQARLAAHDRYRNLLDGSRQSNERLIKLIHTESQLLLAGVARVARQPKRKRGAFYRALRELVPYVGQSQPLPPD
jgi:hypothetical protein